MKLLRNLSLILLAGMIALACSKETIERMTTFRYSTETNFTIARMSLLSTPLPIPMPEMQASTNQEFANNNTSINLVKNVALERLSLSIVNPQDQTFKFLRSVKIFISASGLPKTEIASLDDIPTTVGQTIDLNTTTANLDSYIKKDRYTLTTEVVVREATTTNIDARANMTFRVTADLIKK